MELPEFKPVLYCFQGGGTGAIESHIGELKALNEYMVKNDRFTHLKSCNTYYTGTSAGAITASLLAEGWDVTRLENMAKNTPVTNWFKRVRWRTWGTLFGWSDHIYDNSGLARFLLTNIGVKARTNTSVAVTRLNDYYPLMFNATPKSVLASSSILLVFKPVDMDGVQYVDGGILNNIPLPTFTEANDYAHIFVFLCTQSITGQHNNTLGKILDLLVKVMEREAHQVLEYGWGDLPHVTIFNPPPFKHTPLLKWSPDYCLMKHAYEYTARHLNDLHVE